ncbi:hypothetical protein C8J56DRAFT_1030028 [Mycena floridula]|nr:hypothetical protein C8J56DRAFT_1030028 [Mycena floridula]
MHFTGLFSLTLFSSSVLGATWLDIKPALASATSQVETLRAATLALPATGVTASQALGIYSNLIKLRNSYDVAATSVNTTLLAIGPPSLDEATSGCPDFQVLGTSVASVVTALAEKQSAFDGASIGTASSLKQGLTSLNASVKHLNTLWFNIAPEEYKQYPIEVTAQVDDGFDTVLAKF